MPGSLNTIANFINNSGEVAGQYLIQTGNIYHDYAFTYIDGVYKTISLSGSDLIITGINDLGEIVGKSYNDQAAIKDLRTAMVFLQRLNFLDQTRRMSQGLTIPELLLGTILLVEEIKGLYTTTVSIRRLLFRE